MSSGSWLGRQWGIGSKPGAMNVWDKADLGFVQPQGSQARPNDHRQSQAGRHRRGGRHRRQDRAAEGKPRHQLSGKDGQSEWYSTMGNDLDVALQTKRAIAVPPVAT